MLLHRKDKRCPEQIKTKIGTGKKERKTETDNEDKRKCS